MSDHPAEPGWIGVERFLSETLVKPDAALKAAVSTAKAAGMPAIEVAPTAGKLLMLLARISGARRVLEIGTLAGFSTIWLARGMADGGTLVTCEYLPEHAAVARKNIDGAGLAVDVDIRVGPALDTLPLLAGGEPFDLVFIDADKANNIHYLEWAVKLSRPGTLIVVDNVVWDGRIIHDESLADPAQDAAAIRASLEFIGSHPRLEATAIQTVGAKGWDGFALALVR
ncbi:O-methyltransferase [Arthrobacter sp. 35W]|uniref:O-methyltransferase n=1 Tax=Arthrobacter sp. 35W TaxID=1132441 RepID=UPI0004145D88|nr:O-methyltransferase [Arthrobacter sp. 35W]